MDFRPEVFSDIFGIEYTKCYQYWPKVWYNLIFVEHCIHSDKEGKQCTFLRLDKYNVKNFMLSVKSIFLEERPQWTGNSRGKSVLQVLKVLSKIHNISPSVHAVHSFLLLCSISVYKYTTIYLFYLVFDYYNNTTSNHVHVSCCMYTRFI